MSTMNTVKQENVQHIVPVQIDSSIAIRIAMGAKMVHERALMARADIWHKIKILRGAQYDKITILKAILLAVEPADLIPVKYKVCGEDAYFIVRNCGPALEKLCKTSLIIKNVYGDPVILVMTLGFASIHDLQINIQPCLLAALTKRYNPKQKTLDLERFHTDANITEVLYCPLSQLRISIHVLKLASAAMATFQYLNLQHNELFNISAIENANIMSIKYLDLRYNNLLNMNMLTPLKNLKIIKLWLDGNPLCENYSNAKQYVESAKRYCPYLQELDGVCIVPNMPLIYKDYCVDNKTQRFVHKFVSHFFNLHDQVDKTALRGLYHKNAFYSMSFAIPAVVAQKKGLSQYTASRNLLRKSSNKNNIKHIYQGQDNVLVGLSKLPKSYHDKSSFVYDIMYDDDNCIVICVSGLFKKLAFGASVLSFSRTFVILAALDNEYLILNDQYHINAAPEGMTPDKIAVEAPYDFIPTCFSPSEKSILVTRFEQITTLSKKWSENYLLESNWDMRKAISNFMKDYKTAAIPECAFIKVNT